MRHMISLRSGQKSTALSTVPCNSSPTPKPTAVCLSSRSCLPLSSYPPCRTSPPHTQNHTSRPTTLTPTWKLPIIASALDGCHQHALLLQVHVVRQRRQRAPLALRRSSPVIIPTAAARRPLLLLGALLGGGGGLELVHDAKPLACGRAGCGGMMREARKSSAAHATLHTLFSPRLPTSCQHLPHARPLHVCGGGTHLGAQGPYPLLPPAAAGCAARGGPCCCLQPPPGHPPQTPLGAWRHPLQQSNRVRLE